MEEYYPTPQPVIGRMLDDLNLTRVNTVLEPSAGDGRLVESVKKLKENLDIDCVELNPDLRHILRGKGFRVVADDFLLFDTMKEYDLILMNPPFSKGCKHLLKALSMQERNGGAVICLLNAETLRNPYTAERQALRQKLMEYGAYIEYLGHAFADADRPTSVEVALVKVQLPEVKGQSVILNGLIKTQDEREFEAQEATQLADRDFFKAIVAQYKMEVEAGIHFIKEYNALKPFILADFGKDPETGETVQKGRCILKLALNVNDWNNHGDELSVNAYIREVRKKYWKALFNNPKFTGKLTQNLSRAYANKISDLAEYEFSMYNVLQMRVELQSNIIQGIEDTIINLFDKLSHKYHWMDETSSNIHYYNGWKTNKAWIINQKVVIPLNGYRDLAYPWGGFKPTYYQVVNELKDMEKCFNYLNGELTDALDLEDALKAAEQTGQNRNIELKYFYVTFFKKGTCHIKFKDVELLKKFNIFGSQRKGWLPPSYGKKCFDEMKMEEQAVVEEFQGREEYARVMANKKYYLCNFNMVPSLGKMEATGGE